MLWGDQIPPFFILDSAVEGILRSLRTPSAAVLGVKRLIYDNMLLVLAEVVTPVKTGVQKTQCNSKDWIPAFAGMTETVAPKGPLFPRLVA
jgi:hypothetical protein